MVPATHGQKTLKEAVDSAFEAYMADPENMLFAIGSTVGPHPYPGMVRDFQAVVGYEAKEQFRELTGKSPDYLMACVGGGCNSLGLFTAFLDDTDVKLVRACVALSASQSALASLTSSPSFQHLLPPFTI